MGLTCRKASAGALRQRRSSVQPRASPCILLGGSAYGRGSGAVVASPLVLRFAPEAEPWDPDPPLDPGPGAGS